VLTVSAMARKQRRKRFFEDHGDEGLRRTTLTAANLWAESMQTELRFTSWLKARLMTTTMTMMTKPGGVV